MLAAEKIEVNKDGTRRGLSNLAVQMIAFGGSIGTGLFLGADSTIHRTGPSIILVYLVIGIFFFLMMRAIGEMMYSDPEQHTFVYWQIRQRTLGQICGMELLAGTYPSRNGRTYSNFNLCQILVP